MYFTQLPAQSDLTMQRNYNNEIEDQHRNSFNIPWPLYGNVHFAELLLFLLGVCFFFFFQIFGLFTGALVYLNLIACFISAAWVCSHSATMRRKPRSSPGYLQKDRLKCSVLCYCLYSSAEWQCRIQVTVIRFQILWWQNESWEDRHPGTLQVYSRSYW